MIIIIKLFGALQLCKGNKMNEMELMQKQQDHLRDDIADLYEKNRQQTDCRIELERCMSGQLTEIKTELKEVKSKIENTDSKIEELKNRTEQTLVS